MDTTAASRRLASAALAYDFDHPRLFPDVLNDLWIRKNDLGPGDDIGTFDLPTTEGGRFRSSDLPTDGRPVLLAFGSRTCPITESAVPGLRRLHERYGHRVRFVMLAVREAHPGAIIPQPHTPGEKAQHAAALRSHHALPFEVAIDELDGALHRRLGSRPSSAFLVEPSGRIAFRAQWSNETDAIAEAVEAVAGGTSPRRPSVTRTLSAFATAMGFAGAVHDAAGKGARLDTWRIAPPLGVMMLLSELLFFLPRERRGGTAMALMTGIGVAIAATLVAALY